MEEKQKLIVEKINLVFPTLQEIQDLLFEIGFLKQGELVKKMTEDLDNLIGT